MDLNLSPEEEAFRGEIREFLAENLTDEIRDRGRLLTSVYVEKDLNLMWSKKLADRGWLAWSWPEEHGGPGWSAMQRHIFFTELGRAGGFVPYTMGVRMVGPVVMKFGTPEQKAKYLPRICQAEDRWCQGYSEPGSGSDLASLQTRAVRDGDHYVVNGTKIWTTGAHQANRIFCLVRTDPDAKPQEGISFLLFDMDQPGVEVKPIITLAGDHELNQVFFDNVRVPVENLVGEENKGWTVAKYLLEYERGGDAYAPKVQGALDKVKMIAAEERADGSRLADDADFTRKLAEAEITLTALEYYEHQAMAEISQGRSPGAAANVIKTRGSETMQKVTELGVEALGYYAAPDQIPARTWGSNVEPVGPDYGLTVTPRYLNTRAASIYAGSNEIQRTIMAKMVLGM